MTDNIQRSLLAAWFVARCSEDPSTQLGAILIPLQGGFAKRVEGWNRLPASTPKSVWQDRDEKLRRVIHAEEDVIIKAAKWGVPTHRATIVCPWACCVRCAGFIVEAGISAVIVNAAAMRRSPDRWKESIAEGHTLLKKNRVRIISVEMTSRKPKTRFNGEEW